MSGNNRKPVLTREDALKRTNMEIKNIHYNVFLNLKNTTDLNYKGYVSIDFEIKTIEGFFLNYSGEAIEEMSVNNKNIVNLNEYLKKNWVNSNLYITYNLIENSKNNISIKFVSQYSSNGYGMCYTKGSDGNIYKYVQSEPAYYTNIVPSMDQPDLKAKLNYYITAEDNDMCVSIENPTAVLKSNKEISNFGNKNEFVEAVLTFNDLKDITNLTVFNQSKVLSTYLYNISCGPFVKKTVDNKKYGIDTELNLYARKTASALLDLNYDWISFALGNGVKFYENYFGTKFHFNKADLLFLPEFSVGAMEFPGSITCNEDRLLLGEFASERQKISGAHIIYHELAHMWFGDLVTMKWWDDIWLNESFAEFISFTLNDTVKDETNKHNYNSWLNLKTDWGFQFDELSTSHPIYADATDTDVAQANFDGISYSKGPIILKQMVLNIGEENFKTNLKNYFKKYEWSNTSLNEFLDEMKKGSDFNMEEFRDDFLKTKSFNRLKLDIQGEDVLKIEQTNHDPNYKYLRNHKIKVAYLDKDLNAKFIETIKIDKRQTFFFKYPKNVDPNEIKVVFINYDFHTWARFELDEDSHNYLIQNIDKFFKDSLNCQKFLSNNLYKVMISETKSSDYLDESLDIIDKLGNEINLTEYILTLILNSLKFVPNKLKQNYLGIINNKMLDYYNKITDKDIKSIYFDYFVKTIDSSSSHYSALYILKNNINNISKENKWQIYFNCLGSNLFENDEDFKKLYDELAKNTDKDYKNNMDLKINAMKAGKEEREKLFKIYTDPVSKEMNYFQKQYSIAGFNSKYVKDEYKYDYYETYFDKIIDMYKVHGFGAIKTTIDLLNPGTYKMKETIVNYNKVLEKLDKVGDKSFYDYIKSLIEDIKKVETHMDKYFNN